ncbi:hypothetical protein JYT31_02855 [Beggiatoa alba]|nr:hypothetical protein [Beggiatoa alba]
MPGKLRIYVNGEKVFEYEQNTRHPGKQREFLDNMDLDMDEGIELDGDIISSPNSMQRAQYVAMSLLYGIQMKSEGLISASCGYLVTRLPKLKQIRAVETDEEVTMDLIFEEEN